MTPERWQHIKGIYYAALERPPGERASFLDSACGGDEAARREVSQLISAHDESGEFLNAPAFEVAARALAGSKPEGLRQGQVISHYRVIKSLGAGSMGEVYLAQDVKLNRAVALKLLPVEFSAHRERLRRFEQEACATSALNHPNILTIYEIGDEGERHFIAAEYIEGETLRQRLARSALDLREALDIAIQIAAALAAAHKAQIVHRDVKPENIMVRRDDGLVKVLDFGLAKSREREPGGAPDSAAATKALVITAPGTVLGTVAYMSPEQARGLEVDERTDIWSLGCVLYEMVAGKVPFAGASSNEIISAIISKEQQAPLARFAPDVPGRLEEIVAKALRKDREQRYQTARDLALDLKGLKEGLAVEARLKRGLRPDASGKEFGARGDGSGAVGAVREPAARTGDVIPARPTASVEHLIGEIKRHRTFAGAALLALLVGAVGLTHFAVNRNEADSGARAKRSLAVLPLKPLSPEAGDDHLGLGIADTIIMKISQAGGLVVRPTSAVRKYADQQIDALEAARQLQADSVLDGTYLRAGDRLRVSVNLLRAQDGASLWAETFDMRFTDIFAIQDEVSKEVAARLRLKLSPAEQARLTKRPTTNPEAYSYYAKAVYHFGQSGFIFDTREETEIAIDLFKKAVELDPNYAQAHAGLGFAYAWMADFWMADSKEGGAALIANAKEELRVAERLDPELAAVHAARSFIFWTRYEGWQYEAAIREARLAKQLDPRHDILAALYYHVGLEEQSAKEFESALEQNPTSELTKRTYLAMYYFLARPDDWMALNQRLFNGVPDPRYFVNRNGRTRYYLEKRMLEEAAPLVEQEYAKNPDNPESGRDKALLLALQGKHREAQAAVPRMLEKVRRDKAYHHFTYDIARIYALGGKSDEALKWLRVTVEDGFPCYTLFARDPFLDPIRKDPAFVQFMAEMKTRWEGYRRKFG